MRLKTPPFSSILLLTLLFFGCDRALLTAPDGMVLIPEGEAIIGVDSAESFDFIKDAGARQGLVYDDALPSRRIFIENFYIDRYEVTNREYKLFCENTGHPPPSNWVAGVFADGEENFPVSGISWYSAGRYCQWASKRLPTEEEWEKAARGFDGNIFPWGSGFQPEKANIGTGRLLDVSIMEGDKSIFGVYGLGGNVMEWTSSWYERYPGSKKESEEFGKKFKVVRGGEGLSRGHYSKIELGLRSYVRLHVSPEAAGKDLGFRCAKDNEQNFLP